MEALENILISKELSKQDIFLLQYHLIVMSKHLQSFLREVVNIVRWQHLASTTEFIVQTYSKLTHLVNIKCFKTINQLVLNYIHFLRWHCIPGTVCCCCIEQILASLLLIRTSHRWNIQLNCSQLTMHLRVKCHFFLWGYKEFLCKKYEWLLQRFTALIYNACPHKQLQHKSGRASILHKF